MAEAGTPRYPEQLTNHLRNLSEEKNDKLLMYREWAFCETEDSGEADKQCPCGKAEIRRLCYIVNQKTKARTFVGTTCAEFFDDVMKEVIDLTLGRNVKAVTGKYKGSQRNKEIFEVRDNLNIVQKVSQLRALFNPRCVPIYKNRENGKWEIGVLLFKSELDEYNFILDESYRMEIKFSRWSMEYGEGFSFCVNEIEGE